MNRRDFLFTSAAAAAASSLQAADRLPIKKAVLLDMLPKQMSFAERLQLAKDTGYEAIEAPTMPEQKNAEELKNAADKSGIKIHSVMNQAHWKYPLSSGDAEVVTRSRQGMETSLRNAHLWGAETVLLVPAVVNPETTYQQAWDRSVKQIKEMIPLAQELKVIIAVEEVWNKFLLSPIEFARYVDQFQSPWVKAYFDVGNVVLYAYPQDWIRTLGPRIVKLHLKDFRWRNDPASKKRVTEFVNLQEGDIDWKAIHQALRDINYRGYATVELSGGDRDYLADVNRRFDLILQG